MLAHFDIEIFVDAFKKFTSDPLVNSRGFIDYLRTDTDAIMYGKQDETNNNILSYLLDGRGDTKIVVNNHPLKAESHKIDKENPYQVFFCNVNNEQEKGRLKSKLDLLTGFMDDYQDVFAQFKNERFFRVDKKPTENKFEDWQQVLPDLPVTEIIISDPYLLTETKENPLEENYYRLLRNIGNKYKLRSLLVFSKIEDIEKLPAIEKESRKILGSEVTFKIILFQKEHEHDRHIYLNYGHVWLGSSVNAYFNEEGIPDSSKKSMIEYQSYANPDNFKKATIVLEDLQKILKGLIEQKKVWPVNSGLFLSKDN